jgi:hypothetical protein
MQVLPFKTQLHAVATQLPVLATDIIRYEADAKNIKQRNTSNTAVMLVGRASLLMSTLFYFGRVTSSSAKPSFLEDQFVSFSRAFLLRSVRLGRPYQEHKIRVGIARKVTEARKHPQHKVETFVVRLFHPDHAGRRQQN